VFEIALLYKIIIVVFCNYYTNYLLLLYIIILYNILLYIIILYNILLYIIIILLFLLKSQKYILW